MHPESPPPPSATPPGPGPAAIDWKKTAEMAGEDCPRFANGKVNQRKLEQQMRHGTYRVCIIEKETGKVLYPSVPANSVPEIIRVWNEGS